MSATRDSVVRYSPAQRWLHWLIAVIAVGMLAAGMTLGFLGFEGAKAAFGLPATNALYFLHKSFGVTLLILMLVRLWLRLRNGAPAHDPPLEPWQRIASTAVHHLLYIALIVQPVIGWLATGAGGFPVTFFGLDLPKILAKDEALSGTLYAVHGLIGWALIVLIALHVGGALMHWLVLRDRVITRMSLLPPR